MSFDPSRMRVNEGLAGREAPPEWNRITERVIACEIEVHTLLGAGLLERLYEDALIYELEQAGLCVEYQVPIRLRYKSIELGKLRIDLLVEKLVVVELKSIDRVVDIHGAQLLSYLRSADLPLGLLINFNHVKLTDGVTRRINPRCSLFR